MKNILLVNGSPKGEKSTTYALLKYLESQLPETACQTISVKNYSTESEDLNCMVSAATDMVIAFPLYIDSIPAVTQNCLEEIKKIPGKKPTGLYVIVNCGFPEGEQIETALDIMQCFARSRGYTWKRGIGIGMGGMINPAMIPPKSGIVRHIYDELDAMALNIAGKFTDQSLNSVSLLTPKFRFMTNGLIKRLYRFLAGRQWISLGRKNRIKHSLDYRPYTI